MSGLSSIQPTSPVRTHPSTKVLAVGLAACLLKVVARWTSSSGAAKLFQRATSDYVFPSFAAGDGFIRRWIVRLIAPQRPEHRGRDE
jgi:hypothetical protein